MKNAAWKPQGSLGLAGAGIAGLALSALVVLGAGGIVYRTVAPNGWLAQLFDRDPSEGVAAFLVLLALGVLAWLTRGSLSPRKRDRLSQLVVLVFAAAGLVQAVEFLLKAAA
jgi:hypothetical protein